MTRRVHRHTQLNNLHGLKSRQTLRARHHPRAHPVRDLPQEILSSSSSSSIFNHVRAQITRTQPAAHERIRPGDDFYMYVNGDWLRHTSIPSHVSSYGVSEEVETVLQGILYKDVQRCMKMAEVGREQTTPDGKACDAIGRLAMSAMRPHVQGKNIEYLKRGLRSIGCIREAADISRALGSLARSNVRSLLELNVIPGEDGYVLSVAAGELGLPAASYYSAPTSTDSVLESYTRLIRRVCKELDVDDLSVAVGFEASLASAIYANDQTNTREPWTLTKLQTKWPSIDWNVMFLSYGVSEKGLDKLRVYIDSYEWITHFDSMVKHTPFETWYAVLSLHILLHALPYLPPPFDTLHFEFYGKQLRGQAEKLPQTYLLLNMVKQHMSTALGRLFVKRYMRPEIKTAAMHFTKQIIQSAIRRMLTVEWMPGPTQRIAAEKLRRITCSVGWSGPLVASPPELPSLQTDTLLANLYLLESALTDRKLRWLQTPPRKDEWEETPYSVNAYYYHDTNELVIPIGSFMWPFIDLTGAAKKRGVGWNYGGLGAVIGHELTHAFDQEGKEFDSHGRAASWWSRAVNEAYQAKTKALVRLFNEANVLGRKVNGTLTLDENLADLGGLAIALDALHHELRAASADEKQEQLRQFFLAYAVSWRTKEHPQRRLQRLILDKHAPIELRVNLIVSQFEEWYQAFDVRTEDKLYVPPEERIRIF